MSSIKKKTSAKPVAKSSAKPAAAKPALAKHSAARASQASSYAANDWQKGASEWAKQNAKLYQLPFAQNDAQHTTASIQSAAASIQSATEQFLKQSTQWAQQFMNSTQNTTGFSTEAFAPNAAIQQVTQFFQQASKQWDTTSLTREAYEQLSKTSANTTHAAQESMELSRENIHALMEVANVITDVSKEIGAEAMNYLNKSFGQNVELSKQVLTCRTLNDVFDLFGRIVKTNLDNFFTESVKLSEMLFQCATDVSEPLNDRVSETTDRLSKVIAA